MFQVGEAWRTSHVLHRSYHRASLAPVLGSYLTQVSNKGRGKLFTPFTKFSLTSRYITDCAVERLQSNSKTPLW